MFEIYRPEKDATIYEYAERVNAGIDEIIELNTQSSVRGPQDGGFGASRILMDFPDVEGDFSAVIKDGPNAFGTFGFEVAARNPAASSSGYDGDTFNLTLQQALISSDAEKESSTFIQPGDTLTLNTRTVPNAFAFFGERRAPKREIKREEELEEIETFDPSAWLRLWFTNGQGLPKKYTLEAFPVTQKWIEGRGRLENQPPNFEAANWIDRTKNKTWDSPGGTFSKTPRASETFDGDDPDVYMNVNAILSEELDNGFLIKRNDESYERLTQLKFFSSETRTIYVPQLLVGRDDYEFNTEGAEPFDNDDFTAYAVDLQETYSAAKKRFKVTVREQYEQRDFLGIRPTDRTSEIGKNKYLPERSLTWKIADENTGVTFFPFDKRYSAVSFNGETHYFDVNLNNLLPKRKYKIVFKYTDPKTGNERLFDHNQTFKVE
jgi:hypothetical protein